MLVYFKKPHSILFIVVILCFIAVPNKNINEKQGKIRIGAIFILSGIGTAWGTNELRGVKLAVEQINNQGGIRGKQIELIVEDEPSGSSKAAIQSYYKLTRMDKVDFILGPSWQDEVEALAPISEKDGKVLITMSYARKLPKNVFSYQVDADIVADKIAEDLSKKYKKIAVLSSQQAWEKQVGTRVVKAFKGKVLFHTEPLPDTTDVKSIIAKLKGLPLEAIFISSYELFSQYTKELVRLKINLPVYGAELDKDVINSAGKAAEGVVFLGPSYPSDDFISKFRERFKEHPDNPASRAYDAMKLLAKAIEESGESTTQVNAYLQNITEFKGASGLLRVESGTNKLPLNYFKVVNSRIVSVVF